MTTQLYLTPLPDAQTTNPPSQNVRANVNSQGLIQQGGVATEKIATENIDLSVTGQFRLGPTFAKKLSTELQSLSESNYSGLAFYDPDADDNGDRRGYYELQNADVNPAHRSTENTFQYTLGLTATGTKQTHWRAVSTKDETISTGLATGSSGLIGIPGAAIKPRWYDVGQGTETASVTNTLDAELGQVKLFDPAASTFTDPTLIFELPYADEGNVDVRVWDDSNLEKYATFDDGGATVGSATVGSATVGDSYRVVQWPHAYHEAFEFEGAAVVDNGLIRVAFDEEIGLLRVQEWSELNGQWQGLNFDHSAYTLFDADVTAIGPSDVAVFAEFEDTGDGSIHAAVLSIQRGIDGVVVRQPDNGTVPGDLETMLQPFASDQTSDRQPAQTVKPRSEVR